MAVIGRIISWRPPFLLLGLLGLISLIALAPTSCTSNSFNFQGKWSGKRALPNNQKGEDPVLNTIAKVDLDLKPNARFTLLEGGIPKEGHYRVVGQTAYLKVDTFMDRPIEDQGELAVKMNDEIELTGLKDGSILFNDPDGIVKESVRLKREKPE